jgi:hypothetical protein
MRHVFLALTTLIVASGGNTAFAQDDCPGGQRPVPPAVAERMAPPVRLRRYQGLGWKYVPVVRLAEYVSEPICSRAAKPLLRASVIIRMLP